MATPNSTPDTQAITWRTNPGTRTGVDTAYIGTAEHATYEVESRGHYNPTNGSTRKVFRVFRVVDGKHVPVKDGGVLKTRKAAYEQAEADYADVLADRKAEPAAEVNLSGIKTLDSLCLRAGEGGHTLHMAAVSETCRVPGIDDGQEGAVTREDAHAAWGRVNAGNPGLFKVVAAFKAGDFATAKAEADRLVAEFKAANSSEAGAVHYLRDELGESRSACGVNVKRARVDLAHGSLLGPQWENWANLVLAKPAESRCYATSFASEHAFDGAAFEGAGSDWEVCEKPKDDPIHAAPCCDRYGIGDHDSAEHDEQSMTFTAAEVRIIRAVLAEVSAEVLRAAGVDREAADALWKRMRGI